jgi:hypothetical protein
MQTQQRNGGGNASAAQLLRDRETRIRLDDCTYIINLSNASPALEMLLSLGPILEDLTLPMDKDAEIRELPVGKILARLNSPDFGQLRNFLIAHINVIRDGAKPYRFADNYDQHLDMYPAHYVPVLVKSFGFQFSRFFRAGAGALGLVPAKFRAMLDPTASPEQPSE